MHVTIVYLYFFMFANKKGTVRKNLKKHDGSMEKYKISYRISQKNSFRRPRQPKWYL